MRIINQSNQAVIAQNAQLADSFFSRMIGLLKHSSLEQGEALIITKCQSIHMVFMRFAIDAIFVSKENKVVGLVEDIKPFQLSRIYFSSSYVIELPVGVIGQTNTAIGDKIDIQK